MITIKIPNIILILIKFNNHKPTRFLKMAKNWDQKHLGAIITENIVQQVGINLLKLTGYGIYQQVEHFNICTLCPYCIYVFFICLRTNSDLYYLH
jgi:hypothetical protein